MASAYLALDDALPGGSKRERERDGFVCVLGNKWKFLIYFKVSSRGTIV